MRKNDKSTLIKLLFYSHALLEGILKKTNLDFQQRANFWKTNFQAINN